jgi:hypothetical protein
MFVKCGEEFSNLKGTENSEAELLESAFLCKDLKSCRTLTVIILFYFILFYFCEEVCSSSAGIKQNKMFSSMPSYFMFYK